MIFSIILSSLVVLGFASKELKASELMNHVNEKHVSHSHDHDHSHTHKHDHDNTKNEQDGESDHSHVYEISVLNTAWNFEPIKSEFLKIIFIFSKLKVIVIEPNLNANNVPLSIFRPPIV